MILWESEKGKEGRQLYEGLVNILEMAWSKS